LAKDKKRSVFDEEKDNY